MRRLLVLAVTLMIAGSAQASSVLDRIKSSGVIRLGYRADAEPYSYQTPDHRPAGYIVDICKEVAERLGPNLRAEYILVPANQRFESVRDGQVDLLCDPSSTTIARREIVDFSLPVFLDGAGVLSRASLPVERFEDTRGKRVGVLTGTTTERVLRDSLASLGVSATIIPVGDHREGMELVWSGKLDAYFADRSILAARLRRGDRPGFELSKRYFSYETYALALPRDNSEFRLQIDRILAQLYRSGRINTILQKTFGDAPLDDMVKAMFIINALPDR
jgi:polar amino acid transport system substrate-binding protein/glutamate/aspartate transport system substrate-binding protein